MKVMILAAGLGTRLRPLTTYVPKPLLPLMLRPMLERLLEQLQGCGVQEVVINLHHQAEQLRHWLGDGSRWQLRLHVSYEPDILGTAGALKRVESRLQDAPFVVMNADVLMDIDLPAVWHWHCQRDAMVTMVVRPDPAARHYGAVVVDTADRVRQINGRPATLKHVSGQETVFTGLQVISPPLLDRIPPACFVSTTADIYPAFVAQGAAIYAYRHTGYWIDVGVPERYRQAHWDVLDGRLGDQWWQRMPPATRVVLDTNPQPSGEKDITIVPPVVLGATGELAAATRVGPYAVLGPGCRLEVGAKVRQSVLWENVQVGMGARITRSILGTGVCIAAQSVLDGAVRCV